MSNNVFVHEQFTIIENYTGIIAASILHVAINGNSNYTSNNAKQRLISGTACDPFADLCIIAFFVVDAVVCLLFIFGANKMCVIIIMMVDGNDFIPSSLSFVSKYGIAQHCGGGGGDTSPNASAIHAEDAAYFPLFAHLCDPGVVLHSRQ